MAQLVRDKLNQTVQQCGSLTLGIDGATNVLSQSRSNVIAHTPLPFFIEYLRADLQKESSENLSHKVADIIDRLRTFIVSGDVEVLEEDSMMSPPSLQLSFVSDSCKSMRSLRHYLVEEMNRCVFAYGCCPHALNNLCMDIYALPQFKASLKQSLFVSKSFKSVGILRKIMESICKEKLNKVYTLVFFSTSRWSSINYMVCRLLLLKSVLISIPSAILHESEARGIDPSFKMPKELETIMNKDFWTTNVILKTVFDLICKCIGALEADQSTMSLAYAAFVAVRAHIQTCPGFTANDRAAIDAKFLYRWDRIYSPTHALAFICDPLFCKFHSDITKSFGSEFLELNKGSLSAMHEGLRKILGHRHEHKWARSQS